MIGYIVGSMSDEDYLSLTRLQELAMFYRYASGYGSQGGYDRLFMQTSCRCPYPSFTRREQKIWEGHWKMVDRMPRVIRDYIKGDLSIAQLGKVTDIPTYYKETIG